jgi:Holliday junction resolvasome RuvABC DNA-binding subunit
MRGWREGRGRLVEIPAADLALAACDAEVVAAIRAAELVDGDDAVPRTKDGKVRTKRRPPPTLTIPKATRDFVWQRDHGSCRVPGCRATRNLTFHHLEFQCQGGDHAPENIILICDGHHKLLHDGLLTITGRAPDELTFVRNGTQLIDARAASELDAASSLRDQAKAAANDRARLATRGGRFEHVVKIEQVKQALVQLNFKARAARAAAEAACAHVGADADIGMLVKAALELERSRLAPGSQQHVTGQSDHDTHIADAKQALVQLGYSAVIAADAVEAARVHVKRDADLSTLIKEALRRCTST